MFVYIASPYTGNEEFNTKFQLAVAERLRHLGFLPFCPLLTHFWNVEYPHPYKFWIEMCLEWVELADAVIRLGGESKGADLEVDKAKSLGIPIYYSIDDLIKNYIGE